MPKLIMQTAKSKVKHFPWPGISWAVAGRNEGRLSEVLKTAGQAESADLSKVGIQCVQEVVTQFI